MERYLCPHIPGPIQIDGDIAKPVWQAAPWTADFQDIEGDKRPRPRFRTRAKMLWDDTALYIAAELEEPHLWATLTRHDSVIFRDHDFEVFIDPDGDNHLYLELEINALNTTWDLLLPRPYRDGGPAINGMEVAGMQTAVRLQGTLNNPADVDTGWTVEIALPWAALGELTHRAVPPAEGEQWRVNFSRVEWTTTVSDGRYVKAPNRPEDNWVWSPQGVVDMHQPERWGVVEFTREPVGSRTARELDGRADREALMRVYHAQSRYRSQTGEWAPSLAAMGLDEPSVSLTVGAFQWSASSGPYWVDHESRLRHR